MLACVSEQLVITNSSYTPAITKGKMIGGIPVLQLPIHCYMAARIKARCVRKLVFVSRYCSNHLEQLHVLHHRVK